jgi:hypothetical protein
MSDKRAVTTEAMKTLKARTGWGLMDCKRALELADGDIDGAAKALTESRRLRDGIPPSKNLFLCQPCRDGDHEWCRNRSEEYYCECDRNVRVETQVFGQREIPVRFTDPCWL